MGDERVLTEHPEGKKGVRIRADRYQVIKSAILAALPKNGGLSFEDLGNRVREALSGSFRGSVGWYCTVVKLDMEAKGELLCDRSGKNQVVCLGAPEDEM